MHAATLTSGVRCSSAGPLPHTPVISPHTPHSQYCPSPGNIRLRLDLGKSPATGATGARAGTLRGCAGPRAYRHVQRCVGVLGIGGGEAGLQRGHQALALLQDLVHAPEQALARRQQPLPLLLRVRRRRLHRFIYLLLQFSCRIQQHAAHDVFALARCHQPCSQPFLSGHHCLRTLTSNMLACRGGMQLTALR